MIEAIKNKTITVLNGGFSREKEVSLRSGKNVYDALIRLGYKAKRLDPAYEDLIDSKPEIVFNALHGQYGEDGSIQSLLDFYGIPYTGSGAMTSILAMNKLLTKQILKNNGLPSAKYVVANDAHFKAEWKLDFPVIIKPISEGSSVGCVIIDKKEDYYDLALPVITSFGCCLVEEFITGQEITVGILEKSTSLIALPILELRPKTRFYDYEAKYTDGMTEFILPAELSKEATKQCQEIAMKLHELLECRGMSRVDMIYNIDQGPFILESNTIPGLTDLSDLPAQAKCADISFEELIEIILRSAI